MHERDAGLSMIGFGCCGLSTFFGGTIAGVFVVSGTVVGIGEIDLDVGTSRVCERGLYIVVDCEESCFLAGMSSSG